jgi:hypothetical protein
MECRLNPRFMQSLSIKHQILFLVLEEFAFTALQFLFNFIALSSYFHLIFFNPLFIRSEVKAKHLRQVILQLAPDLAASEV